MLNTITIKIIQTLNNYFGEYNKITRVITIMRKIFAEKLYKNRVKIFFMYGLSQEVFENHGKTSKYTNFETLKP